jgi:ornithine cyclodeaminase
MNKKNKTMIENQVKIIQGDQIKALQIHPRQCIKWVEESFRSKNDVQLPAKNSVHPQAEDFFTSMPCLLPEKYGRYGIKVVHRIQGAEPTLGSDILLYDSQQGKLLAMIDGDWITGMRTGAVAALSVRLLKRNGNLSVSIMGLGNTARATLLCLLADNPDQHLHVRLLAYKNQEMLFMERFKDEKNVSFEVINDPDTFFGEADIIISCITAACGKLMCPKDELFKEGVLVVPVHTRGFQNCDLFFDQVFGDDYAHIAGFKYFQQFKHFEELGNVLTGKAPGRTNDKERILAYNVGIGLHDILFASKIYDLAGDTTTFVQRKESDKYWL